LLDALAAAPRSAGGAHEAAARARCAELLRDGGFEVREEPFEYSALPGLWATPIAGAVSGLALAAAGHAGYRLHAPRAALALLVAGAAALGVWSWWSARHAVLDATVLRRRGINLVATRGATPRVWLAAHLDSKRQPVSILVRAAGITLSLLAWAAAAVVAVLSLAGANASAWWPWVSAAGVVGAVPVALSVVRDGSPGALDNASGAAATVLAACATPDDLSLGVLLTSAEELGLAGAAAWARARTGGPRLRVLNCDGVDDDGATTLFYSGRAPTALLAAVSRAARATLTPARVRRLLPGILADSVALANAGHAAVTVSRGGYGTLSRIHRRSDRADRMNGRGIALVARLLAAAAVAAGEDDDGH
jgi:hypothetical protein